MFRPRLVLEEQTSVLVVVRLLWETSLANVLERLESVLVCLDLFKGLVALSRVHLRELGIFERALLHELDLLGREVTQETRRNTRPELTRRDLLVVSHDRAGRDDRLRLHDGAVKHLGTGTNDAVVLDRAGVDDRRWADGDVAADLGREVLVDLGHVDDGVVLDVGVLTDRDVVDVAAHGRAVPDGAALADLDITDHGGIWGDERALLDGWRTTSVGDKTRRRVQVLCVGELALERDADAVERLSERADALAHDFQRLLQHAPACTPSRALSAVRPL